MRRVIVVPLLAAGLFVWACDGGPPTAAEDSPLAAVGQYTVVAQGGECTYKCTRCNPPPASGHTCDYNCFFVGACRTLAGAVDRNENGIVCGATVEGPFVDDQTPQKPGVLALPRCTSPAFPLMIVVAPG